MHTPELQVKNIRRSYRQLADAYARVAGEKHTPELQVKSSVSQKLGIRELVKRTLYARVAGENYTPELQAAG
jgi:hypothetical protein